MFLTKPRGRAAKSWTSTSASPMTGTRVAAIGNNMLTIRTFLFSPLLSAQAHACTANFCVFFFYRTTGETEAHFTATGMQSQRNQSDSFGFKRNSFYQSLKSKVGLAAAKAAALRINLNVALWEGCYPALTSTQTV